MKRTAVILLTIILTPAALYAEEKITLSTFYPAPHGEYEYLAANSMVVGRTYPYPADDNLIVEGSVGIGTTDLDNLHGSFTHLRLSDASLMVNDSTGATYLFSNAEYNATGGYHYLNSDGSANFTVSNAGIFTWRTAPAGTAGNTISYTERMRLTQDGNIGIGTTSPGKALEIDGDALIAPSSGHGELHITHRQNSQESKIIFKEDDTNYKWTMGYDDAQGNDFFINRYETAIGSDGSNNVLTIDAGTDNVGIGTTSPEERLEVNGNIITSRNNSMPHIVLDSSGSGDAWTSQGAYISLGESGDLGSAALHLTYRGNGYGWIGSGAVTDAVPAYAYLRFDYNSKNIYSDSNITTDGNIGIGRGAGSTYKLQVAQGTGGNDSTGSIYSAGQVHIKTTSSGRDLKVNGDAGGMTAWYNDSDERLKDNICTIDNALEKTLALRGIEFTWKDQAKRGQGTRIGLIAQETIDILPEVVSDVDSYYSIQYAPITALLVEAVKDINKRIDLSSAPASSASMTVNSSGNIGIGTANPSHPIHLNGGAYCDGTGAWITGSDRAYKKNIDYGFKYGLKQIRQLRPVYYVHRQDKEKKKQIGFIAQDIQKVMPEIVSGTKGALGLSYGQLTAVLVKAMQEQQVRIEELQARIEELELKRGLDRKHV